MDLVPVTDVVDDLGVKTEDPVRWVRVQGFEVVTAPDGTPSVTDETVAKLVEMAGELLASETAIAIEAAAAIAQLKALREAAARVVEELEKLEGDSDDGP